MSRAAARLTTCVLSGMAVGGLSASAQSVEVLTPTSQAPAASAFRSATELVPLQVAVTDASGRYVSDLRREDFAVFEEGVRQDVTLFATGTTPLDVMILLDTSFSMEGRMAVAQKAALNFVRALKPGDRAAVVLFDHSVSVARPLTADLTSVGDAIRAAVPSGGTAVHEAVYIALRELVRGRRGDGPLRRQAVVVLTDGDDNSSHVTLEDVVDVARRSTVTVYTVVPPAVAGYERPGHQRPLPLFDLRSLAEETGGRAFVPARLEDLSGAYREIAEELGQQYWLAYVPSRGSIDGFRRVSVRVETRPELQARTRSGYYAARPRASLRPERR